MASSLGFASSKKVASGRTSVTRPKDSASRAPTCARVNGRSLLEHTHKAAGTKMYSSQKKVLEDDVEIKHK